MLVVLNEKITGRAWYGLRGGHVDSVSNLKVLCQSCHRSAHANYNGA